MDATRWKAEAELGKIVDAEVVRFARDPWGVFVSPQEAEGFLREWESVVLFDRKKFRSLAGLICRVLDDEGVWERERRDRVLGLVFGP